MGAKSKAQENGLVELIIDKWEGGKNTIVYVTEEVNKKLQELGLTVVFSRESIRRVIKNHKEEADDYKKGIEAAKTIGNILKDNPGTEIAEGALLQIGLLINKELKNIDSLQFETAETLCNSAAKVLTAQTKGASFRVKYNKALDKAKAEIKKELQAAIKNDNELLTRLYSIIDKIEVK